MEHRQLYSEILLISWQFSCPELVENDVGILVAVCVKWESTLKLTRDCCVCHLTGPGNNSKERIECQKSNCTWLATNMMSANFYSVLFFYILLSYCNEIKKVTVKKKKKKRTRQSNVWICIYSNAHFFLHSMNTVLIYKLHKKLTYIDVIHIHVWIKNSHSTVNQIKTVLRNFDKKSMLITPMSTSWKMICDLTP